MGICCFTSFTWSARIDGVNNKDARLLPYLAMHCWIVHERQQTEQVGRAAVQSTARPWQAAEARQRALHAREAHEMMKGQLLLIVAALGPQYSAHAVWGGISAGVQTTISVSSVPTIKQLH